MSTRISKWKLSFVPDNQTFSSSYCPTRTHTFQTSNNFIYFKFQIETIKNISTNWLVDDSRDWLEFPHVLTTGQYILAMMSHNMKMPHSPRYRRCRHHGVGSLISRLTNRISQVCQIQRNINRNGLWFNIYTVNKIGQTF